MEQLRSRIAAFAAMALCCGLVMVLALGVVTLTGAWLAGGVAALVIAACVGTATWLAVKARNAPAVDNQ